MTQTPSPLRYPGGKTKLYNYVSNIVNKNMAFGNRIYVEPFAGGAGLALKLLLSGDVDSLILNDIDYNIFCFWEACLNNTEALCNLIDECDVSVDNWRKQKNIYSFSQTHSPLEVGFASFYLNRCNVSGVIRGGPIGGFDQLGSYGIDARFNKNKLIEKILDIGKRKNVISIYNLDASAFLLNTINAINSDNLFLNIDPPYVNKGSQLYENSFKESDHADLANVIKLLRHKWMITYDECNLIENLYADFRKDLICLNYSAGKTRLGNEYVIYCDRLNV